MSYGNRRVVVGGVTSRPNCIQLYPSEAVGRHKFFHGEPVYGMIPDLLKRADQNLLSLTLSAGVMFITNTRVANDGTGLLPSCLLLLYLA